MIGGNLTIAEAAREARLSPRTIRRGLRDPRRPLGHLRVGRRVVIPARDLNAWLEAHREVIATAGPALLARVSPAARELLEGFLGTPGAPDAQVGDIASPTR